MRNSKIQDAKIQLCFICGKVGADSVDHVPPKGVFLFRTSDLITVPAHIDCNKASELDDEYFRLAITTMALQYSQEAESLFDQKIMKRLQEPKKWKFRKSISNDMVKIDVHSPAGIYLGKKDAMMIDSKRILRVINRIARGLYYNYHKEVLPTDWPVKSNLMERGVLNERRGLEKAGQFKSVNNGVFKYMVKFAAEDKRISFCWMSFFDCVDFSVFTTHGEVMENPFVKRPNVYE